MIACPVCGFEGLYRPPYELWPPPDGVVLTPPYTDALGQPTYEVCTCCGYEFGNDDDPGGDARGLSFEEYRQQWEAKGRPRFWSEEKEREYRERNKHREPR